MTAPPNLHCNASFNSVAGGLPQRKPLWPRRTEIPLGASEEFLYYVLPVKAWGSKRCSRAVAAPQSVALLARKSCVTPSANPSLKRTAKKLRFLSAAYLKR